MTPTRTTPPSQTAWDVIVIGGGPAGMLAAGRAAERGRKVLLLEKNEKLGKKLLITGGGRCNITNNKTNNRELLAQYSGSDQFLFSAFAQYSVKDTISFFESRGLALKEENDGRMFPVTNKAQSVWNVLVAYMKEHGVVVRTRSAVTAIVYSTQKKHFAIHLKNGEVLSGSSCIVATGGTSHRETGSTGEGFEWLKTLGHTIINNDLALVPISLKNSWVKKLSGVSLPDIRLAVYADGKKESVHRGKILFTHFGISGPMVLNMSREVGELLSHSDVTLVLDLFPQHDPGALRALIQSLLTHASNKKIKNTLGEILPLALVEPLLALAEIDGDTYNHSVRTAQRTALITILKKIPLSVKGLLGMERAVVSSGGVTLSEVHFKTMESRIVSRLFLVGDVLNINRPSGGYSLQLCWTTGHVAGENA